MGIAPSGPNSSTHWDHYLRRNGVTVAEGVDIAGLNGMDGRSTGVQIRPGPAVSTAGSLSPVSTPLLR